MKKEYLENSILKNVLFTQFGDIGTFGHMTSKSVLAKNREIAILGRHAAAICGLYIYECTHYRYYASEL